MAFGAPGRTPLFGIRAPLLACLLCSLLLGGCSRGADDGDQEDGGPADSTAAAADSATAENTSEDEENGEAEAIPVEVAVLEQGPIESVIRASANLEAESAVAVLAEAARRVTGLLVEEGDRVKKRQVLLRLQSDEQRSTLSRTETELAQAQREFDRQSSLAERDLTTDQALQDASDELERRKLAFADAKRELSYTEVRAPISGTITSRMVNLGNQVTVGQHLFDIIDFESLVALIYVPEKNLKDLGSAQESRLVAAAIRDEPYKARVKRVAPVVDPRTGTVKVTIDVGGQPGLRPGLFVDVALITAVHDEALLIPKRALIYDNDQIFLYRLLPERKVERVLVVPVLADRDHVMPLEGFAPGDSVIIAGQTGLKPGVTVKLPGDDEPPAEAEEDDARASADAQEASSR